MVIALSRRRIDVCHEVIALVDDDGRSFSTERVGFRRWSRDGASLIA